MRYLTARQLLLIHSQLIDETGGSAGVRDKGRIESVIEASKQTAFGEELYTGIFTKASVYIHNITADHPFVDGNKRTAILSGLVFLERNGFIVTFKKGEIEKMAIRIAVQRTDIPDISAWLEWHSQQ